MFLETTPNILLVVCPTGKQELFKTCKLLLLTNCFQCFRYCNDIFRWLFDLNFLQDQYKKSNPSYQGTPQKYACFGCLDELLSFLKRSMQDARPDDVYEFSFNSKNSRNVTLRKLDSDGLFVVPKEFKDWLKNQEPGPDLLLPEEELGMYLLFYILSSMMLHRINFTEQMVATFDVPHPEELEDSSVRFEKCAVSWYASRNSVSSEVGYCGQDGSAFDHLQVPSGRHHNVNFNLNRSHPDDDFKLDRFEEPESIGDSLSWIKEFGGQDNRYVC